MFFYRIVSVFYHLQLTPDDVCTKHGLNNVNIDYTEENYHQWTSYKLYADHVRPMVLKENPKVSMTRLVQLIAAKWREFDSQNPYREHSHSAAKKPKEGTYHNMDMFLLQSKGKCGFVWRLVLNTPLRHSGMAHILEGSHSKTVDCFTLVDWQQSSFCQRCRAYVGQCKSCKRVKLGDIMASEFKNWYIGAA